MHSASPRLAGVDNATLAGMADTFSPDHVPGIPATTGNWQLWWMYLKAVVYFRRKRLAMVWSVTINRLHTVRNRRLAEWAKEQAYAAGQVAVHAPNQSESVHDMVQKLTDTITNFTENSSYLMDLQDDSDFGLRMKAQRYGIMLPAEYEPPGQPGEDRSAHIHMLTLEGRTWLRGELRKARVAAFRSWNEIILPVLSLLVALAALLRKR